MVPKSAPDQLAQITHQVGQFGAPISLTKLPQSPVMHSWEIKVMGLVTISGSFCIWGMLHDIVYSYSITIIQCGTSTWFQHFITFSGLDDECITYLEGGSVYRQRSNVRRLLRINGYNTNNVNGFANRKNLLVFTFVRHPFERLYLSLKHFK